MTPGLAVETAGLRKLYGRKLALADLSLQVRQGECFGFLGPNGAGKSTCLKMLLGLVRPTAGAGWLLQRPLGDQESRRRVGFLPEHFHFQDWLSGWELLELHGRLYGLEAHARHRRARELLQRVGLASQGSKAIRNYSKGMQQRIGLAQALINTPELIFLDEPTSGLDPLGRLLVREIIAEERARGATVFLNSHLLGEVEVSCDRVAFVKAGRVLATRALDEETTARHVRLRARRLPEGWQRWAETAEAAGHDAWILQLAAAAPLPELLRFLVEAGAEVSEFTPIRPTLEELFLEIVGPEGDGE